MLRHHVKALFRGKQLASANEGSSLESCGICDRTKLTLMFTEVYHAQAPAIAALRAISGEVDGVSDPQSAGGESLLTLLLCRLDGVDVAGCDWLRAKRKAEILRIERISGR